VTFDSSSELPAAYANGPGRLPPPPVWIFPGEPQDAPGWYPANDNPQDKSLYDFTVTCQRGTR
jgi:hypothetical protein